MKKLKNYRWLFLLIPALLGTYGYYQVYGNLSSAFYSAIRLYSMDIDIDESQLNMFLQIARWLAPLASASAVVMIFQRISARVLLRLKLRKPETIVVHGDGARMEQVTDAMGKTAVTMTDDLCFRAKKHVLAFDSDDAAIGYLSKNRQQLLKPGEKEVYLSSFLYEASDYADLGLTVSNNAVNCARLYWQEHPLGSEGKIALIGFGSHGQKLLEQALLVNAPIWRSPVEYHIFGGDGEAYLGWHPQLHHAVAVNSSHPEMDSIFFHPAIEQAGIAALQGMERLIIAMDEPDANVLCLNRLLSGGVRCACHIRCDRELLEQIQYLPRQLTGGAEAQVLSFGDASQLYTCEVIMHGQLTEQARKAHFNYVRNAQAQNISQKYVCCIRCSRSGLCGDCPQVPATWDALTPFEKASNIAAADHLPVKRRLLALATQKGSPDETKAELCKAEHIRWCRFHYLHNWQYSPVRDNANRLHNCLTAFENLPEADREKNWWDYEQLQRTEGGPL